MRRRLSLQFMVGVTVVLILMLGANLVLVWQQQQKDLLTEMHSNAQVLTQTFISMRLFIARSQDRINTDSEGHFEFKGLNPAAVGRGVGALFHDLTGYSMKQTRFQVRRPENAPDPFEWEALTRFAEDATLQEYYRQMEVAGEPVFRYVVPLRMEKECLACHGGPAGQLDITNYPREGYKEGQLGGAISVTLPMADAMARIRLHAVRQVWVIVGITAVSLLVLYGLTRYLVTDPLSRLAAIATRIGSGHLEIHPRELPLLQRSVEWGLVSVNLSAMAQSLKDLYTSLEDKVAERTRELEQANRLQSQILTTVSHELRTPLTSIIAFTELLLQQAKGREQEYLEDVLDSSRRLLVMVNNLLDLSRLEAGRVELFTDLLELPEVITGVVRALQPLAARKSIALIVQPMDQIPLVLADPIRLQQILTNLLGNALKFTPDGGQITISATRVDSFVELCVADTGPGVPSEYRSHIFEAFRQAEGRGAQHPGSGLGLAVARNLVELHGGSIRVEEAPGGGSRFCFTLPAASSASEEDGNVWQ